MRIYSEYNRLIYHSKQFKERVNLIQKTLEDIEYDVIVFRGISGAAAAFPLSLATNKPLLCVRKPGSHSHCRVEGAKDFKKYVIVDDFIHSGWTLRTIKRHIKTYCSPNGNVPECVAIILYNHDQEDIRNPDLAIFKTAKIICLGHVGLEKLQ